MAISNKSYRHLNVIVLVVGGAIRLRYEYGMVAHALSAAMSLLLREYFVLVAQLEQKALQAQLSPQKLWFYLQPSVRSLEILDGLCQKVRSKP